MGNKDPENQDLTDADINPDEMDSAFFAAAAYANGAVWDDACAKWRLATRK